MTAALQLQDLPGVEWMRLDKYGTRAHAFTTVGDMTARVSRCSSVERRVPARWKLASPVSKRCAHCVGMVGA
jgi:hypothetical protein